MEGGGTGDGPGKFKNGRQLTQGAGSSGAGDPDNPAKKLHRAALRPE
jgi:hypothetical protein